jgi:hypothetical protein
MRRHIHAGFISGMLLASGIAQAADQIKEAEVWTVPAIQSNANYPISYAQKIEIPNGGMSISGVLGYGDPNIEAIANDTDYYRFYGLAGDVVTLDIDEGKGGVKSVDTIMAIYDDNALKLNALALPMRWVDDADPVDEGSISTVDARIDNVKLPNSGYYIVGVTSSGRAFGKGGVVTKNATSNGDYKLIITGVTPEVQQINIEIKPGSDELAPINPKAKGKIPVALLSSSEFIATNVDTTSLRFGESGNEESLSHCGRSGEDVNGDGRLDLVCHFDNEQAGFAVGDLEGILRGKMTWGSRIEGRGFLKVVPEKRGS